MISLYYFHNIILNYYNERFKINDCLTGCIKSSNKSYEFNSEITYIKTLFKRDRSFIF